jgi:hypothetical protein
VGLPIQLKKRIKRRQPDQFVIRLDLQGRLLARQPASEESAARVSDDAVVMQKEMVGADEGRCVEGDDEASFLTALTDRSLNLGFARINPAARQMQQMTSPQPGHAHQSDKAAPLNHGEGGRTIRAGSLIYGDPELRDRHQSTEESAA